jgi:hemolysin III
MAIKERFNSISHMVGGGLSIVGTIVLLWLADNAMEYVAASVYGFGLIALYTMSSVYHGVSGEQGGGGVLERLDHVAIYLLIAGTYTPLCLLVLPPVWGWGLLAAVWIISTAGIVLALTVPLGPAWLHPVGYIVLGWAAVFVAPVLFPALSPAAQAWLIVGGVIYTGGAAFYVIQHRWGIIHTHHLWHLFVIAGSVAHYIMVVGLLV